MAGDFAGVLASGEITITPKLYREAIRVLSRRAMRMLRVFGALFALAGVLERLIDRQNLGIVVGLMVAGALVALWVPFRTLRSASKRSAPAMGPWRYEVSAETLTTTTPLATGIWAWASLRRVQDHPRFWLLHTPIANQAVTVFKDAFSPQGQAVVAQLAARVGPAH